MRANDPRPTRHRNVLVRLATVMFFITVAAASCGRIPGLGGPRAAVVRHGIIPEPAAVELVAADTFMLDTTAVIAVEPGNADAERIGRYLAELIGTTAETTPLVQSAAEGVPPGSIELRIDPGRASLGREGYDLGIRPDRVRIVAAAPAGLFYGVQTLRQLLPPWVEYTAARPRPMPIPTGRIVDRPRFAWRGAMLDVSRHFLPPEDVKRFIDLLALYKLNRLHLHLSDDQGWRIEIKSWPNLAKHGGSTQVGGLGGGYYTQEEYAELVRYAADRFITIVPEIDMPGHINAALASYPELNCDGEAASLYTDIRVGFSALCVEKEITYRFINDVVREIAALTPGEYFHIGGDEVEKLTEEQYHRFITRAQEIVHSYGKRMIGWGEIATTPALDPTTVVQHWKPDSSHLAVARGSKVILSPAEKVYFDMKYDSTTVIGLTWAGPTDVRDAYDWEPATWLEGVPAEAILGLEAPFWSETLGTIDDVEYMAFPRITAVAERAWSAPERTDWERFRLRLGAHEPRWSALGVNYRRSPHLP